MLSLVRFRVLGTGDSKCENDLIKKTYSLDGFKDGGSTCQGMWVASSGLWRTASKDTEISGPQLQGTESCRNPVHLEEDPNLHLRMEPRRHPGFSLVSMPYS